MKLTLVFLAIVGLAVAVPSRNIAKRDLGSDLEEFWALLDTDCIGAYVSAYEAKDEEFQSAIEYVNSDDFSTLLSQIAAIEEFDDITSYLEEQGIDLSSYFEIFRSYLGMSRSVRTTRTTRTDITGGLLGYFIDISECFDVADWKTLYESKLAEDDSFAELIEVLQSETFSNFIAEVRANELYQELKAKLVALGFDIDSAVATIAEFFGLA